MNAEQIITATAEGGGTLLAGRLPRIGDTAIATDATDEALNAGMVVNVARPDALRRGQG
ncbi:hypothetical protein [Nonomuraea sp. NPDC049141]|uniref:hypothetical protein n=1 Tax=Nonomuraea sp. NPDC049141 TaxID=3155500 RepID=UPI003410924C